jgi:biotin-(acetyl-CoA carboxylase) ligase
MNQKKHTRKKIFHLPGKYLLASLAILMLFLCSEASANASAQDVHNIAGISMQANRVLKDYALVGMEVNYHNPAKELEDNLEQMDHEFKNTEGHKMNKKLTAEIVEIKKSWYEIKPEFEKKPDKMKMHELREAVEKFTFRCEEVAEDLAKDTGIKGENDIVLLSKLGMESQRLAAEYITKVWGVAGSQYDKEVENMMEEIRSIFKELMDADDTLVSQKIKNALKSVEKDFIALNVMATSKSGRFMPSAAEKMASKIFKKLNEIIKVEQEVVEKSVSGYFMPIADERNVNGEMLS